MNKNREMTLEEEIAALRAQINILMVSHTISPARQLQNVRHECRTKYFGTWNDIYNGEVQYGPDGKQYSDYEAVMDIVNKTTGLLFKYSRRISNGGAIITSLIKSEEDVKDYKAICEAVCLNLRKKIDEYTENDGAVNKEEGKA